LGRAVRRRRGDVSARGRVLAVHRLPAPHCHGIAANCNYGETPMKITQLHALRVRIPQKPPIAPYQSRYRATSAKEALLIRLETDNGVVGWGETPEDWLTKTFEGTPEERMRSQAVGRDPFDLDAWY